MNNTSATSPPSIYTEYLTPVEFDAAFRQISRMLPDQRDLYLQEIKDLPICLQADYWKAYQLVQYYEDANTRTHTNTHEQTDIHRQTYTDSRENRQLFAALKFVSYSAAGTGVVYVCCSAVHAIAISVFAFIEAYAVALFVSGILVCVIASYLFTALGGGDECRHATRRKKRKVKVKVEVEDNL